MSKRIDRVIVNNGVREKVSELYEKKLTSE